MNKELLRMQMLAGIITESQYKNMLNENEEVADEVKNYFKTMIETQPEDALALIMDLVKNDGKNWDEWIDNIQADIVDTYGGDYKGNIKDYREEELNEVEIPNQLKQTIQQEYPEIVQSGKIEQGTEEWVFLLKLVLESMYDGKYKRFFDGIDEYDLFINGEYESYYDMIKNTINESMFEVTDLKSLLDEMDTSDLIDAVAEAMGGNSANAQDMQKAKNALLAYGVNELNDFSYINNLEQALEELGVEII